jgi:Glycosyl transferase family 11
MIVLLQGGLGNQMFQYAFGRSVSRARNEELLFEKRGDMRDGIARFNYSLDVFKTGVTFTTSGNTSSQYKERIFAYDKEVYTAPNGTHFTGYWQTEKYYFEPEIIRAELSLRNVVSDQAQRIADEISAKPNSVFIHVRRTDYLSPDVGPWMGNLTIDYYKKSMAYVRERISDAAFFVFSDDPEWCRQKFEGCRILDQGQDHEDLFLMSQCKHAVIANSSFGWWGAWLGDFPGKTVIAPYRWFAAPSIINIKWDATQSDIIPNRWIKI